MPREAFGDESADPPTDDGVPPQPFSGPLDQTSLNPDDPFGKDPFHPFGGDRFEREFFLMRAEFAAWALERGYTPPTMTAHAEASRIAKTWREAAGHFDYSSQLAPPPLLANQPKDSQFHIGDKIDQRAFDFMDLFIIAVGNGFTVTATTDGTHGFGSFHYDGRAIDVSMYRFTGRLDKHGDWERVKMPQEKIDALTRTFARFGVRLYDETNPSKLTSHSTGLHLHYDTATQKEIRERAQTRALMDAIFGRRHYTREDYRNALGIGSDWPLRRTQFPGDDTN